MATRVLKPSLVHCKSVDDGRFRQLNVVVPGTTFVTALRQREVPYALILRLGFEEVVPSNQRVPVVDRIIKARSYVRVAFRHQKAQTHVDGIKPCIENSSANQFIIVGLVTVRLHEERGFLFDDWAAEISAELPLLIRSTLAGADREWIARIQTLV